MAVSDRASDHQRDFEGWIELEIGKKILVAEEIVDEVEAAFASAGFTVSRNAPFAGAYVTQNYGRLGRNQHAVQVEIDRSIYMDERLIVPHEGFDDIRQRLHQVIAGIAAIGRSEQRLAAE